MKHCCCLALVLLACLPLSAQAQFESPLPPARLSVTPFVGVRIPTIVRGTETVVAGEETSVLEVREQRAGGPATGLQVEVAALPFLSVIGAVAYSRAGDIDFHAIREEGITEGTMGGPEVWFAKAGISVRLPEPQPDHRRYRSVAFLTVAPALIRESEDWWRLFPGEQTDAVNNWGISLGAEALTAIRPNLALHIGLEDYVTFWNTAERRRRHERYLAEQGTPAQASFSYNPSNVFLARVGITLRR